MATYVGKHYKYMQAKNSKNIGKSEDSDVFPHLPQNVVKVLSS